MEEDLADEQVIKVVKLISFFNSSRPLMRRLCFTSSRKMK